MPSRRTVLSAAVLGAATLAAAPMRVHAQTTPGDVLPTRGTQRPVALPTNAAGGPRYRPTSRVGLGCAPIGNNWAVVTEADAEATIEAAWDGGMRLFDTSPWYGLGRSERRLGHVLGQKPRDEYVVSSKVGRLLSATRETPKVSWKDPPPFDYRYDYSAAGTRRSIEDSLQRMGLDAIDIVLIHDLSPDNADMGERWTEYFEQARTGAFVELSRMRDEGLIKAWGMGVNTPDPALRAIEVADPDIFLLACQYSLLDHQRALDDTFPKLAERDISVIVGSPPTQRGVVCAASYEARQFKVRSAMPSRTAGKLCPHGIFVRPRMDAYRAESGAIMEILRSTTPTIEKVSVDEAYLDVSVSFTGYENADAALEAALPLAEEIKRRIAAERQLTASIGVASNKFLAKLGSDFQKPDGLTVIREREKVEFLRPLSVRSIHGVGPVTAEALEAKGLHTIGDLQTTAFDLREVVGSFAESLKRRAFGNDDREVDTSDERKSISAENTFLEDTDDRPTLREALREMAADVAQTLEQHEMGALTVQVKVRYSDFSTLTRQLRLEEPVTSAREIYRLAQFLLARDRLVKSPLRLIGIGLSTLVPPGRHQLLLPI